ncbi:glycosyltransferase [Polaribacter marinivivus]|uniref:Glycosyltransferase n=1 Tax=Polaribacter marinivivus TaxID=1524260 RepID=A0ABV8RBC4_9FLAO
MKKRKNILIISTPDISHAAGVLAYDLHQGLLKYHNSQMMVYGSKHKRKDVVSYFSSQRLFFKKVIDKLSRKLKINIKTDSNYYFFDINQRKNLLNVNKVNKLVEKPDVIIGYFANAFFNIKDLYDLQLFYKAPVILFMADMIHITGGCHFAWDCEGYKNSCSNCPAIIEDKHKKHANKNLTFNNHLIKKMDIQLVAVCSQDYNYAKESTLFKDKNIKMILGGIDLSIFYQKNQEKDLRNKYNIDINNFVILFGATNTQEKRKGVKYFIEAIQKLENEIDLSNFSIVSIGRGKLETLLPNTKAKIHNLGYISDFNQLSDIYNMVNLFVVSSIQDSGPMMINQSIASGTPVVCFDLGVAKDIVLDGITGYKAPVYNSSILSQKIKKVFLKSSEERKVMANNCSQLAIDNFSKEVAAKKILELI